jgi:hypothetical protein
LTGAFFPNSEKGQIAACAAGGVQARPNPSSSNPTNQNRVRIVFLLSA